MILPDQVKIHVEFISASDILKNSKNKFRLMFKI